MILGMCSLCDTLLVSTYGHDFSQCDCKQKSMIDGGGGLGSRKGGVFLDWVLIIDG